MPDHSLVGPAHDTMLEPRLRALLAEQHRLVLQSVTDAVLVTGVGGVVEYANEAAHQLFNVKRTLRDLRLADLFTGDDYDQARAHVQRAIAGDAVRAQLAVTRADGDRRRVNASLSPIREHAGISGLVAVFTDFTDEARARDEVSASNTRFRDLADAASDAVWTVDRRGLFTSVNPATLELCGLTRSEMLGRSAIPMIAADDQQAVAGHFRNVLGGQRQRYECHILRKDGSRRLVSVANSPILAHGSVSGILGVVRDLTEERSRAVALEQLETRYSRLTDSAEDAIATIDAEGHFTSVNRALEKVSGRPRTVLVGTHFVELLQPAERAEMWRLFASTIGGERTKREVRFTRPDGAQRIAMVFANPLIEAGRVTGVLAVARDVTDERLLQEQVARQEKLAALGELVSGVAHELNSPLQAILTHAQYVERLSGIGAETLESAQNVVAEAKRASRIVSKLLTFARQNPPERMVTDVNQVMEDTLELRRYPLRMQDITLDVELDRGLPLTWADPFQLQQVFINLLGNAEQAVSRHGGERRITVRTRREEENLVIEVADSGPGIAPEHLAHIFNPFYTTKPRGSGTGLGLSIADGIVREHGGSLRVQSDLGRGARFEIVLPLVPPPAIPS